MSNNSRIEWTESTWNPVTGCSKVSQGCKHCYAEREWTRMSAPRPQPNIYTGRKFTDVMTHSERLDQPLRWAKPRMIFVNSMSDLFHEDVPNAFIDQVFAVMALAKRHTFQVLTKRPERMLDYFKAFPQFRWLDYIRALQPPPGGHGVLLETTNRALPNVWLGVSIEDQPTADERIPLLLQCPAVVRWVSAEPLLGPIDLNSTLGGTLWIGGQRGCGATHHGTGAPDCPRHLHHHHDERCGRGIDWVVVGGESGLGARPMHPQWVRSLRDQCAAAGVPFFFKQWGELIPADADECDPGIETSKLFWSDGKPWEESDGQRGGVHLMAKVGKKAAGNLLDGVQHHAFPADFEDRTSRTLVFN